MSILKVVHIVGARPNFMKAAAVLRELGGMEAVRQTLVHTGQHYDANMSAIFFEQLGVPRPDHNLEVGPGSHAEQTGEVMKRFEALLPTLRPDLVLVYGDVNSTMAAALVCAKAHIPVGHVEAGLRSFDRTMPEEINRVVADQVSSWLFTTSAEAETNLVREGVSAEKIHFVGNTMIDTLVRVLPRVDARATLRRVLEHAGLRHLTLAPAEFGLVTMHRPSNVDDPGRLRDCMEALSRISEDLPLVFPVHPRTRARIDASWASRKGRKSALVLAEPLGYVDFLGLLSASRLVITDSGGVQEESTYLDVPCLTMRENTERPVTVELGSNVLVGADLHRLSSEVTAIVSGSRKHACPVPLWDGHAAARIAVIVECLRR